jgi:hypothetical protein
MRNKGDEREWSGLMVGNDRKKTRNRPLPLIDFLLNPQGLGKKPDG